MYRGLGRLKPTDWAHVDKYPWRAIAPLTTDSVEKVLKLPYWHKTHDQGHEGSCVGHGLAMERAIANTQQNVLAFAPYPKVRRYNPLQIWNEAKLLDEWPDTNPGDDNGTSVRAGYDVLRTEGAQRVSKMVLSSNQVPEPVFPKRGPYPIDPTEGISANRWATTVDEVRTAISQGIAVAIGVNWYESFYHPVKDKEWWIPSGDLGRIMGGHCVCLYGASDRRQAFKLKNSWGRDYPEVWLPYAILETLLSQEGEVALVTDK